MSIIGKIKESIEGATVLPFYYDTPQTLNVRLELGQFPTPAVLLHILQSNALTDTNGILRERLTIELLFTVSRKTPADAMDFDGTWVEDHELDEMKMEAFKWLLSLYKSHTLRLISLNGTNRYYATDDIIYDAYGVNVTLEEIQGVSKCDLPAESAEN